MSATPHEVDLARDDLFHVLRVAREPILPLGGYGEFDELEPIPSP